MMYRFGAHPLEGAVFRFLLLLGNVRLHSIHLHLLATGLVYLGVNKIDRRLNHLK